jgi:sugar transferase (PEP-CTERM/EpsH1 system associated)
MTSRPRILYVTHRVPYPPDKGDRIRCLHVLRFLAARADVHLACLADEPPHPDVAAVLRPLCREMAIVPLGRTRWLRALFSLASGGTASEGAFWSTRLSGILRDWLQQGGFDATLASASSVAPYLMQGGLRDAPAVIDLMDVDSQKWLDYSRSSNLPRSWLHRLEGLRLRRLEHRLARWARAIVLVAPTEADLFHQVCPHGHVQVVTNGVDLDYFAPGAADLEEPGRCVFVGAMDYAPNVDGAGWFCREVWPEVRRRWPRASLALVGRNPTPAVHALARVPGVEVVGTVPDVRSQVSRACVTVVPLRIARGVQNKVLESMAMGKATVVSPPPLQGLHAIPDEHLLLARSPAEWVACLTRLFERPALRRQLGAAARAYARTNHCWEHCLAPLAHLLGMSAKQEMVPASTEGTGLTGMQPTSGRSGRAPAQPYPPTGAAKDSRKPRRRSGEKHTSRKTFKRPK